MRQEEDGCVGCPTGWGCYGDACPKKHEIHLYCDHCGDEQSKLYGAENGDEVCISCLKNSLETNTTDDIPCEYCGTADWKMYKYNGEWVCEDCLLEKAELED